MVFDDSNDVSKTSPVPIAIATDGTNMIPTNSCFIFTTLIPILSFICSHSLSTPFYDLKFFALLFHQDIQLADGFQRGGFSLGRSGSFPAFLDRRGFLQDEGFLLHGHERAFR
jgi:hypothetical protein